MTAVSDGVGNVKAKSYSVTGPASYATGGFLLDCSADFSVLGFIVVEVAVLGALPVCEYEILLNRDTAGAESLGKAVIKILRYQSDVTTSGGVTNQPSGVTLQSSIQNTATSTHTHTFDHNHSTVTSGAMTQSGAGSTAGSTPDALGHTHVFTIPNFTGTTPAGGSHSHQRGFQYDHRHDLTTATTDIALSEVTAATNLSAVTFTVMAFGFGSA